MQSTLPHVEGGQLYQPGRSSPISVGTPIWFEWLERHGAFVYVDPAITFNAHKISSQAGGSSWEATSAGEDQHPGIWLGSSSTLTLERLQAAARALATWPASAEPTTFEYWTSRAAEQLSLVGALPKARLARPRLRSDVVPRPQLLERLSAEIDCPLTLLCAPAGYGKTTLLAQWLTELSRPVAWLSLDEQDDALAAFLRGLVASLQRAVPGTCHASASMLRAPELPPLQKIVVLLLNDLADIPEDVLVVLDDYHLILTGEIHSLLSQLVEHLPEHVHLVLASRTMPPLPLARWLARGQMHVLDADDLRFTLEETQRFLSRQIGDDMAHESARVLMERTEGWVAMLRLAALSLRRSADPAAFIDRFEHTLERSMNDYLIEEVLAQLPPGEQEALVRMSLVAQFNAELGAAILGNGLTAGHMQTLLEEWERANPFVVPLEGGQKWYRLHHMMKQALEQRLTARTDAEELTDLHQRASRWYAERGLLDEALHHALAAGDVSGAAQLVEAQVLPAYEQERWKQLERWMQLLPEEQVESRPFLLVARVWILQYRGQLKEHPRLLAAAEQLLTASEGEMGAQNDPSHRFLRALIRLEWCRFYLREGRTQEGLESTRAALEWLPPDRVSFMRTFAIECLALFNQLAGQEEVGLVAVQQALEDHSTHLRGTARLLIAQSLVHLASGKLPPLEHTARQLLRVGEQADLALSRFHAHWALGLVFYEWNDLDAAIYHLTAVITNSHLAPQWVGQDSMSLLALSYQAQGLSGRAQETAHALLNWLHEQGYMAAIPIANTFCARLALMQGEMEVAEQWLNLAGEPSLADNMMFSEDPPITKARLLLARGDEVSVAQGQALLSRIAQHLQSINNTRKFISVLALQAWAYEMQGRRPQALAALERALALARPSGFIRTFADLPGLAPVLGELRKRRKADRRTDGRLDSYLQRILAAMVPPTTQAASMEDLMHREGLEPLTERELHILYLLNRDLTNKEIARELVVTPGTVKVHTNNLYRKLSVDNRRAAVALARTLGLLVGEQGQGQLR